MPVGAATVTVGGGACCDRIRFSLALAGEHVTDAGFDRDGCGAASVAANAAVTLVRGRGVLGAATFGAG